MLIAMWGGWYKMCGNRSSYIDPSIEHSQLRKIKRPKGPTHAFSRYGMLYGCVHSKCFVHSRLVQNQHSLRSAQPVIRSHRSRISHLLHNLIKCRVMEARQSIYKIQN